ncbi:MAG: AI-2E family transporter [Alphaproteobacteria bacterium]|nr:MAG: AI-2E family transporter [Alphaproteobacteria bacterium]
MASTVRKVRVRFGATNYALGFIVLFLAVYVLSLGAHIFVPLVIAIFIWYLINAIARWLAGLGGFGIRIPRLFCFSLSIGLLLLGIYGIFELIKQNVTQVAAAAPHYQQNFEAIKPRVMEILGLDHIPTMSELVKQIDLAAIIKTSAGIFTGFTGKTVEVLFLTGFLLYEQRFFDRKIQNLSNDRKVEDKIRHIIANIDHKIQRYIGVKTLVSALSGIVTYAILKIAEVDFAAFWGLMAFFLHFIPYVGTFAAIALPSILTLVQFGDFGTFLSVTLSLSVALMLIGHILDPRLLGEMLNLSPICIIISLAVWHTIWGVPGMFLAIPILAIIVITLSQFDATRSIAVLLSKTGVIEKGLRVKETDTF